MTTYNRELAQQIAKALYTANMDNTHSYQMVERDTFGTYGYLAEALKNVIGQEAYDHYIETGELEG